MKNFLFYDKVTGEEFLVETDRKEKAIICARHYFQKPVYLGEVTHFEAEMMGIDTYQCLFL